MWSRLPWRQIAYCHSGSLRYVFNIAESVLVYQARPSTKSVVSACNHIHTYIDYSPIASIARMNLKLTTAAAAIFT